MTTPPRSSFVDAVDTTHYFYLAHLHIEVLFGMQDLGRGSTAECGQEILQL